MRSVFLIADRGLQIADCILVNPRYAIRDTRYAISNASLVHVLLLVLFSIYLAGCSGETGPERVAAHGTVMIGGRRLSNGQIRFVPSAGTTGPAAAATILNGSYAFTENDGPIIGQHRIEIEATDFLDFAIDDEQAFAKFAESGGTRDRQQTQNPVPEKYNRQSTLVRTVDAETDPTFDFNLDSATVSQTTR